MRPCFLLLPPQHGHFSDPLLSPKPTCYLACRMCSDACPCACATRGDRLPVHVHARYVCARSSCVRGKSLLRVRDTKEEEASFNVTGSDGTLQMRSAEGVCDVRLSCLSVCACWCLLVVGFVSSDVLSRSNLQHHRSSDRRGFSLSRCKEKTSSLSRGQNARAP